MSTLGERIKERREALGLTQEYLAEKLGYKSRSSINKIELGINDIAQKKISAFAEALNTTPAYLLSWDDSTPSGKEADEKDEPPLDPEVKKRLDRLNEIFPLLTPEQQEAVNALIKSLQPGK